MKIIFIRHSKTKTEPKIPVTCWGLSDEGIELAKKLSTHDTIKQIDILYASLQTKALETAIYLGKPNGIPIRTDNDLTEVTSFTKSFEPDFKKYKQNVKEYYSGKLDRINGGETKQEAITRFAKAVESIAAAEKDKKYVGIVSHGSILTLYSAKFKDIDCYATHTAIKQPDIAIFDWENKKFMNFFGEII